MPNQSPEGVPYAEKAVPQCLEAAWDVDSLDWKDLSAADITQRVVSKVQPGSIVLFYNPDYTIDHTGRQCPCG